MSQPTADPNCGNCHGSGIEPGSGEDYGMPYGIDPNTYEPCFCVLENDHDRPENWRYADRFVAQWVANILNAVGVEGIPDRLKPTDRDRESLEPGWSLARTEDRWEVKSNGL